VRGRKSQGANQTEGEQTRGRTSQGAKEPGNEPAKGRKSQTPDIPLTHCLQATRH